MLGAQLHLGKTNVFKAINLQLGDESQLFATFDPWTMTYRHVWTGGFINYNGYRWGTSRGVQADGETLLGHDGVWRNGNHPNSRLDDRD